LFEGVLKNRKGPRNCHSQRWAQACNRYTVLY